jgi:DNA-binding NarL/FixJ family response regulator
MSRKQMSFLNTNLYGEIAVMKILLVENNISFRALLKVTLHLQFPLTVIEEAADGNEVLEKVDSVHPNLILIDIYLPRENSLMLIQKIKKDHPEIIIGILTSFDLREYREFAFKCGVNYFIAKNSWEEIAALVESISSDLDNRTSN